MILAIIESRKEMLEMYLLLAEKFGSSLLRIGDISSSSSSIWKNQKSHFDFIFLFLTGIFENVCAKSCSETVIIIRIRRGTFCREIIQSQEALNFVLEILFDNSAFTHRTTDTRARTNQKTLQRRKNIARCVKRFLISFKKTAPFVLCFDKPRVPSE